MDKTKNPVEAILDWYKELPERVKIEIAAKVLRYVPGFAGGEGLTFSITTVEKFIEWLNQGSSPDEIAGKALFTRALMDFAPMRHKGTAAGWEEITKVAHEVQSGIEESWVPEELREKVNSMTGGMLERASFDSKQWIKAGKSWNLLCEGPLSDDAIDEWNRKAVRDLM